MRFSYRAIITAFQKKSLRTFPLPKFFKINKMLTRHHDISAIADSEWWIGRCKQVCADFLCVIAKDCVCYCAVHSLSVRKYNSLQTKEWPPMIIFILSLSYSSLSFNSIEKNFIFLITIHRQYSNHKQHL